MYCLIFVLEADPEDISGFIRVQLSIKQVKVAIKNSSYEMETGVVTLHQTAAFNNDNNMKDMEGED